MTTSNAGPQRLYLMQVASMMNGAPAVCYLVQTGDGKNILIDSGVPANMEPPPGMPRITMGKNVVEQLAEIGVQPDNIDILIATHFDMDHAGNAHLFPRAEHIVQRRHYEVASGGYGRFARSRAQWDHPALRYRQVEGDTEILPGLELIESSGHVPGHQSVLVRLPNTGAILLAIDAVTVQAAFRPDRQKGPMDENEEELIVSTRKLLDLAQREHALVIFGHDGPQWQELKKLPEYYD